MAGTFSKSARPVRPGAYMNWIASPPTTVPPAVGSIVCVPFTSDWGPFKQATLVGSFQEYLAVFGPTVGTPGYNAVWQAFAGEFGFEGRWGAGAVLAYRFGGASAAKATHALQNTTPAAAMTVTARYEGSYGNDISVTVQEHLADTTQEEFVVLVGTDVVETFLYNDTDIAGLVAQINANSSWITATLTVDGVALAEVSNVALTGGDDGTTTVAADWTAMMSALETEQFGVLAPYALTDSAIKTSLLAWAGGPSSNTDGRNAKGQRFEVVLGGASDETAVTAVADAASFNDGDFIRVGMGHVIDANLLDVNGNPVSLSPAQYAPRIAGILAQRGEGMSITSARLPGYTLVNPPTESDIVNCINGGVIVLTQDSDPDAPVHVEAARTTFTSGGPNGSAAKSNFPYVIYRNPKFLRTMQNIEMEWTAWAQRTLIGKLPVNSKTREAALADLQARLRARQDANVIQADWTVAVDQDPPPSDDDEFIALVVGIKFGRSVEQVFFTVGVS